MLTPFQQPFAHTFSIVARDPYSGQLGVAVQSHWFSVGTVVPWVRAGVGAIATQSMAEISYGPLGLERLDRGEDPQTALQALLDADEHRAVRQVAVVDRLGRVATHTGERCIAEAGHVVGAGFSVQANMMHLPGIPQAMAAAYTAALKDRTLDLAERLLLALEAAQGAGGDIRGMQSAALRIAAPDPNIHTWQGIDMDLRVEDHSEPIRELRRLVELQRAYTFMNHGDELLAEGQIDPALHAYRAAAQLCPSVVEMPFWHAVSLINIGQVADALPIFADVFAREPLWAELLIRLPAAGLLHADPQVIAQILQQK